MKHTILLKNISVVVSVFEAVVRWHNKYDRLTVSELFVYLLIVIS